MLWACRCTLSEPMGLCLPSLFEHSLTYSSSTEGKSPLLPGPLPSFSTTFSLKFLLLQLHLQKRFFTSLARFISREALAVQTPVSGPLDSDCSPFLLVTLLLWNAGALQAVEYIWLTSNISLWIYADLEALTESCLHGVYIYSDF